MARVVFPERELYRSSPFSAGHDLGAAQRLQKFLEHERDAFLGLAGEEPGR